MIRLQLHVLRRLASNLVLVLLVVGGVVFTGQALQFLSRTPDVGPAFLLEALPYLVPVTLALTLPLAFLVAAVLTYGRLADDNEVVAVRMSGAHPWALVAPAVFAGAVLSFAALLLHADIAPRAAEAQWRLREDVHRRFVEILERGGRDSFVHKDRRISWTGVKDGALEGLHISHGGLDDTRVHEIHAPRGVLGRDPTGRTLVFRLENALIVSGEGSEWVSTRFPSITFTVSSGELFPNRTGRPDARLQEWGTLLFTASRWPADTAPGLAARVEVASRLALSLSPLAFALCAACLALRVGKGTRAAAAVLSLGVALAFFVLWQVGKTLAAKGSVPPGPALLASDAVVLLAGAWLYRGVARQ
jgi:lipopolysaccharide export system permease protein